MRSNYKRLGNYIRLCNEKNDGMEVDNLLGISNAKYFVKAKTNTIGIDLSTYRIVRKGQFAYNRATTRNGDKISIALQEESDCTVSPSYRIFEVTDENKLLPQYLMMWFRRPEFDRYARFKSHGSAHEFFEWEEMCEVELPIPSIEKQREIVREYHTITERIRLNEQLNQKLEETAQALYRQWFVEFEFPDENGKPYKSSGGAMEWCPELEQKIPKGWKLHFLRDFCSKIGSGSTPKGGKENYKKSGITLVRSMNVHDFSFIYEDLAFIDDDQAEKLQSVALEEQDVLLNITGASVARCCIVPDDILPARVNQHVSIIRSKTELRIQHYLLCMLCSAKYKSELVGTSDSGSTRQAITKQDIESLRILLPSDEIRSQFENFVKVIVKQKSFVERHNNNLFELTNILFSKMTTIEG